MSYDRPGTLVSFQMGCFVVAEFLLTSASRGPSAIAEPPVMLTTEWAVPWFSTQMGSFFRSRSTGKFSVLRVVVFFTVLAIFPPNWASL